MPALKTTAFEAEVVWLGRVADTEPTLAAHPVKTLNLGLGGDAEERHFGITRGACVRVKALYERGTEIMNVRQLSVLSQEELDQIAQDMGLETLDPAWIGASIVLKGIPDFSHVPPSARLQGDSGVTITVDMENRPCVLPGRVIETARPGYGKSFKAAATNRRGVTAWVERAGALSVGNKMRLFVPDQPIWSQYETARRT